MLGEVGRHYFEERGIEINKQFHYTIQNPTLNRARNISEELLEGYRQGDFDEIYIIYTSMVNAMQEEAEILQLLPLKKQISTTWRFRWMSDVRSLPCVHRQMQ